MNSRFFSKRSNRSLSLQLLFSHGTLSRAEIANRLNITPAAVSIIANELLQSGLVVQSNSILDDTPKAGRKKEPLSLNFNWKYVLAIDIHAYYVNIAVTNLRGDLIAESASFSPDNSSPDKLVSTISAECKALLRHAAISTEQLLGVGITVIGPVNQVDGIALHPFRLFDFPVDLRKRFEAEFSVPVAVESNVCASLISELLYTNIAEENQNTLILKWGPGIGSAMAIGGHIYKGRNFRSAEVGHNRIFASHRRQCNCGKEGCLEPYISTDAIREHIEGPISADPNGILAKTARIHGKPTRNNLDVFLDTQDPSLVAFLNNCARLLATVTNNALLTLVPDKLILMGDLFNRNDIMELFKSNLYQLSTDIPEDLCMRNSTISGSKYIGATATAIDQILLR